MTLRRAAVLALAVTVWLLAVAVPAGAHVELAGAVPAENEVVTAAPGEVRLEFSGPLTAGGEHALGVFGPGEQRVDGGTVTEVSDRVVSTPVGPLPGPGPYTVRWLVIGADGHEIEGDYTFTYEVAVVVPSPPATSEPAPADTPTTAPASEVAVAPSAQPEPEPSPQTAEPALAEDGEMLVPLAAVSAVAAAGLGALVWRRRNGA